jgi:hypothetical protein
MDSPCPKYRRKRREMWSCKKEFQSIWWQ